jgi:uncharacterized membrane protein
MNKPSDQELDEAVAIVLRIGVSLSAAVVILGGVLLRGRLFGAVPDYTHFHAGDPGLRSVMGVVPGAINFAPKSVIQLGLILLIATPVARVVLCVVGFARQRNLLYVAIGTVVLLILIFSFVRADL